MVSACSAIAGLGEFVKEQSCSVDCDGGGGSPDGMSGGGLTIGGTVTGLDGTGLVLANGSAAGAGASMSTTKLTIKGNGAFTFPGVVAPGAAYSVGVASQPASPTQACTVSNGSGKVGSGSVTNIVVTCTTSAFTVGGGISGLDGTIVLSDNGGD